LVKTPKKKTTDFFGFFRAYNQAKNDGPKKEENEREWFCKTLNNQFIFSFFRG